MKVFLVGLSVAILDILWVLWMFSTEERKAATSALWSALIMSVSIYSARHYIYEDDSAIAAIIGAAVGTFVVVTWKRRGEIK